MVPGLRRRCRNGEGDHTSRTQDPRRTLRCEVETSGETPRDQAPLRPYVLRPALDPRVTEPKVGKWKREAARIHYGPGRWVGMQSLLDAARLFLQKAIE